MRNRLFLAVVALATASASVASDDAQDVITIVASRTPVPADEIGSAVTIIERERIEQRQVVFAADLLQDVPGFSVARSGGFGAQTQLRVRGAEANQVQVLIDGVEANDIAANDEFRFAHLTAFDVERIEIVRGPQSALWGSDALSGVVNIVTRQGNAPLSIDSFVEGGAFGTANAGSRVAFASERANGSASIAWLDSDGTNIARAGDEDDAYENLTASLSGGLELLEDKLNISGSLRHTDATRDFDSTDFATGLQADADRVTDSQQTYVSIGGDLRLADRWRQSLRVSLTDTEDENRNDGVFDSQTSGQKLGFYYQTSFNLDGVAGLNHTATLAVDHEIEDFEQRGVPGFFGDPNRDDDLNTTGYVLEYLVSPVESLSVSAGIRHDDNSEFDSVTTYRATASYRLEAIGSRVRASFGTGQKSPTFTERFGFFSDATSTFVGNADLDPETSRGWEVGVDQAIGDGGSISLTYFNERLEDEIDGFFFDGALGAFTATNRNGESDRRGVEFAASLQPTSNVSASAQYTYVDANQPDPAGGQSSEIRRPRNSASANINYRFIDERANVNVNATYTGKQFDTNFATFPAQRVTLDSYTLVNVAASFALNDTLTLYGRVENLLDESYENVFGFATPGIGAFVGARLSFSR